MTMQDNLGKIAVLKLYNAAFYRVGSAAYNQADTQATIDHNLPDNIRPIMGVMAQDVVLDSLTQLLNGESEILQDKPLLPAWQNWHDAMVGEARIYLWIMTD